MDYQNLEQDLRQNIEKELEDRGIPSTDFDPGDVKLHRIGQNFKVTYKGIEISVPAPSQEVIDSWWKENGKVLVGAVIALAGVIVGGIIVSKAQD